MANILQAGKRGKDLPRLTGFVHTGQQYALRTPEEEAKREWGDRTMPSLLYCVMVTGKHVAGDHTDEFTVQFSENEMIRITGEWLTYMNRRRIDAANDARRQAEKANAS